MDAVTRELAVRRLIRLADEPPFALGGLRIDPATRQVGHNGVSETLEPRVMQVLVALAREPGRVISRDALVDCCWDGRIVGENAINRVISRLRALSERSGAFAIETVTKVGYRLRAPAGDPVSAPVASPDVARHRRSVLGWTAAALLLPAAGWFAWPRSTLDPRAAALLARGRATARGVHPQDTQRAITDLDAAVALAPRSAACLGALALTLARGAAGPGNGRATRAAAIAARTLNLDPGNADARTAQLVLRPWFRDWSASEVPLLAILRDDPAHEAAATMLAELWSQVGRFGEAAALCARQVETQAMPGAIRITYALALWYSGAFAAAEPVIMENVRLWPDFWPPGSPRSAFWRRRGVRGKRW